MRIANNTSRADKISPVWRAQQQEVLDAIKADGASIKEVSHANCEYLEDMMNFEFKHDLEDYLATAASKHKTLATIVECYEADPERMMRYGIPRLARALQATGKLDDPPYLDALERRKALQAELLETLGDCDVCVMTGWTNVMHIAGLPCLTLPLGFGADGMPLGLILYALDEERLFAAALTLEKYCKGVTLPTMK